MLIYKTILDQLTLKCFFFRLTVINKNNRDFSLSWPVLKFSIMIEFKSLRFKNKQEGFLI